MDRGHDQMDQSTKDDLLNELRGVEDRDDRPAQRRREDEDDERGGENVRTGGALGGGTPDALAGGAGAGPAGMVVGGAVGAAGDDGAQDTSEVELDAERHRGERAGER